MKLFKGLDKSQRIQLKLFIGLLGILLILILLVGKMIISIIHMDDGGLKPVPHVPVVHFLNNVWIMEVEEDGLLIFEDGEAVKYPYGVLSVAPDGLDVVYQPEQSVREQVADVVLTDGQVSAVETKTEKISGKVLSADETGIEIEGFGRMPLSADYKGYRLFDTLKMCTVGDLYFGYSFADFCVENGEICGILMVKEEAMEYIRVLVKSSDFDGLFHEQAVITSDVDYTIVYGAHDNLQRESFPGGTKITFDSESSYFQAERIYVIPNALTGKVILKNCSRNQGTPAYRGQLELLITADGIVIVNEVPLEEYLYSVVPSEMPSNYPAEALKAQAICARTYAYGHMEHAGYPRYGAHVDDSTSYQVYNNISEQESTTTAVKETYGQLLYTDAGSLAGTYYYSTSCGVGSDPTVWKTSTAPTLTYLEAKVISRSVAEESMAESLKEEDKFAEFITSANPEDFEAEESWYRWTYQVEEVNSNRMLEVLQARYKANNQLILTWDNGEYVSKEIKELDDITDISMEKRGSGGVADELVIATKSQKIKVISEYNIRLVLNDGESKVERQDGSEVNSKTLVPSGFFVISTVKEKDIVKGYTLTGGGYGHGVGMSQNGAKAMAMDGYSAAQILLFFYENCTVEKVYE